MNDRDVEADAAATAEALAKAREVLERVAAELVPLLDNLVPVGRGDGEAHLPNSLRLLTLLFDAADARSVLMDRGAISKRTLGRIAAGEPSPRAAKPVIAALVRVLTSLGRAHGQSEQQLADFESQAGRAFENAAQRWDALAQAVGQEIRPEHAATIVLRVVAVDVGIRLAVLRRVATLDDGPWLLFEPMPLAHAIDKLVLPSLGLTIGDVHTENHVARAESRRWARSTLSRWRLEGVIPEPAMLDEFARDIVAIARERGSKEHLRDDAATVASRTLRLARAAAVLRRTIADAFPGGVGERIVSDFVAAVQLVADDAFEVFTDEGLLVAWALAQTITPPEETVLLNERGEPDDPLLEQLMRGGLTHEQIVRFVRAATLAGLSRRDPALIARVRGMAAHSLISLGAVAPEAIVLRDFLARRLPPSGLRNAVERLGQDPRHAILDHVLTVGFLEVIAERAGEHKEALLAKAAECAAILPRRDDQS